MVAALFGPVLILLMGLGALGWFSADQALAHDHLRGLVSHGPVKILLFVVIMLPMFHWAHRFRFTLVDLGLRGLKRPVAVLCYLVAIAVSLDAAVVLWNL